MGIGRLLLGLACVCVVVGGLFLLKELVDQKTKAVRASLDAPDSTLSQNPPSLKDAATAAVSAVVSVVLPHQKAASLTTSGCLPGQDVAPLHSANFYNSDGRTLVADYGERLTVQLGNPTTGTRCNVSGRAFSGTEFSGSIALADIGPYNAVNASISTRAINRRMPVTLAELPQRIRADLPRLAKSMGVDLTKYNDTITKATNYAQHCSEVTEDRLDAARSSVFGNRKANYTTWKTYSDCVQPILGTFFPGNPRGLYVQVDLRNERQNTPYKVMVYYQRLKDADTDKPMNPKTLNEAVYQLYDLYGVGVYSVTK